MSAFISVSTACIHCWQHCLPRDSELGLPRFHCNGFFVVGLDTFRFLDISDKFHNVFHPFAVAFNTRLGQFLLSSTCHTFDSSKKYSTLRFRSFLWVMINEKKVFHSYCMISYLRVMINKNVPFFLYDCLSTCLRLIKAKVLFCMIVYLRVMINERKVFHSCCIISYGL
jgi:hypothetical protein